MRILVIGLGGAGCRITGSLYTTDRRSSRVACVQALAIDVDAETLAKLGDLPGDAKIYFPPLEPVDINAIDDRNQVATIDIGEVTARVQNVESGERDAIFICCGLGGTMTDVAPHVITALRSTITEPIFGLFTLPCLIEGEKRSAKAAEDIEVLAPLLDGVILFDNETWSKKTESRKTELIRKGSKGGGLLGFKKSKQEISPTEATHLLLNEGIVRRISLLLRAGEFKADGGLEPAEVVLDSGEVINTMKGMGFITIGYAVEHLPKNPLDFLSRWRPTGLLTDEHQKRASRIVELAKQAIYQEISTPCDMTSAAKALVLVAGPSHEISMKGFMTVRKWIDRSIAGLEMRSGDYPVTNTKFVAIIIMLSGLENIPRLTELKEIRAQYRDGMRSARRGADLGSEGAFGIGEEIKSKADAGTSRAIDATNQRDEMIVVPGRQPAGHHTRKADVTRNPQPDAAPIAAPSVDREDESTRSDEVNIVKPVLQKDAKPAGQPAGLKQQPGTTPPQSRLSHIPRRHLVVSRGTGLPEKTGHVQQPALSPKTIEPASVIHEEPTVPVKAFVSNTGEKATPGTREVFLRKKDQERHKIENELQRQRIKAILDRTQKKEPQVLPSSSPPVTKITKVPNPPGSPDISRIPYGSKISSTAVTSPKTVILARKKKAEISEATGSEIKSESAPVPWKREDYDTPHDEYSGDSEPDEQKIGLKSGMKRSNDEAFFGKGIKANVKPPVKDDVLLHTELKSKRSAAGSLVNTTSQASIDKETDASRVIRKKAKTIQGDDPKPET